MLKIPADLILLKGGVLVRWSTCLLYILFFSFSHSEIEVFFLHGCIIKKLIHVYKAKFALN